ncbi:pyridine nucleotide-disulfide oxidoreductase domain/BFD-like [2Fe-2S] binding domain protein [Pseudomonas fluorescens Q2-87]|uniref:Pyridine nucleotide-disulfide oxidoreductase domain/BFD-like [2Fe-2S] binding domain protein n=1 Tax=Pseudomonas fluorescens (strain Q2-87) TaxID=1038922 RepID=J2EFK3_PSEFQ|nr:FAD/NAD(P)-binding oxidoreductase [Pseudomonas fluorescens]EJL02125.1 pyridine nucleotide-disulfide oxidoreductase domain/BFD-like [2Fe-2S] binding domain protein [Pseudomonas fluorescens Q2-87]
MSNAAIDLIIIGAGPAGMGAALEARAHGMSVVVLDEQASPGGQIYRQVLEADARRRAVLGDDYTVGAKLAADFLQCGARYLPNAAIWQVTPQRQVHYLIEGRAEVLQARHLLIATGAFERPMPIPGWTVPGVMTAGAGQILLKSAALMPACPLVLAGCGPLLYLLAVQYLRAGIAIEALVDTSKRGDLLRAWRMVPAALRGWRDLLKGLGLLAELKRAGIRHFRGACNLEVEGTDRARALVFDSEGQRQRISAELILLHQGVVPNTQISWSLRLEHDWSEQQLCWVARRDAWGETSVPGIFIAGDSGAIGGAGVARLEGRLAVLAMAGESAQARPVQQALHRARAARPLLDALYRPPPGHRIPADDVTVCRCEEVSAGDIRRHVDLGCLGPNQTKAFGRCGMGPCQGRQCGLSVTEIIAGHRQVTPAEVGYYRIRSPLKPITLAQLAGETLPVEEPS